MADAGKYKGPRIHGVDYFDDVMGDNVVPQMFQGALGGGGMESHERTNFERDRQGIVVSCECRQCSSNCRIGVTWGELYKVAAAPQTGVLPNGWQRSDANATAYPDLKCNRCQGLVAIQFEPRWCMDQIRDALGNNVIDQSILANDRDVQEVNARLQGRQQQQQMPGPGPGPGYGHGGGWH